MLRENIVRDTNKKIIITPVIIVLTSFFAWLSILEKRWMHGEKLNINKTIGISENRFMLLSIIVDGGVYLGCEVIKKVEIIRMIITEGKNIFDINFSISLLYLNEPIESIYIIMHEIKNRLVSESSKYPMIRLTRVMKFIKAINNIENKNSKHKTLAACFPMNSDVEVR